jgi:hypothetical protein
MLTFGKRSFLPAFSIFLRCPFFLHPGFLPLSSRRTRAFIFACYPLRSSSSPSVSYAQLMAVISVKVTPFDRLKQPPFSR